MLWTLEVHESISHVVCLAPLAPLGRHVDEVVAALQLVSIEDLHEHGDGHAAWNIIQHQCGNSICQYGHVVCWLLRWLPLQLIQLRLRLGMRLPRCLTCGV